MDHDKIVDTVLKWGTIAVVGAGMTWWVNRCTQAALKEAKEITVEVKGTVCIIRDMLVLPHMTKMIDFTATAPVDQTFTWEHLFAMARDGRIVIETIRDIVNSANITHVLAIAEKATPLALPAGENDDGVRQRGRGAALPAPPPADPEITLRSLHEVKGITDNVHNIIDSQNTSKLFDTLVFMQNPRTMYTALQVSVFFDACVPCIQSDRWPTSGSPTYALARRPVQSRRC
eukprot:m.32189 g.32189  ORF g.32189 m.32189 type:complete len:231 (+) comp12406_c0_seq2:194-886(+)